jgi:hexosaminidase
MQLSMRGEEVMKGYSGGHSLQHKNGYNTVLSNGYYIDLMLSVDSHYLNDPLPKIVLSPEEVANTGREAAMWSELAAPLNIDSKIELPQLPKDYGQMTLTLPI